MGRDANDSGAPNETLSCGMGSGGPQRQRSVRVEEAVFEPGAGAPGSNTASYTLSEGLILTQEYN